MSELDALSKAIGALTSDVVEARRQRERILAQLDMMEREHQDAKMMLQQHVMEFQLHTEEEMRKYQEMHLIVRDYQNTKNKAVGVLMTIAFFGAAAWEGIKLFLRKLGI